MVPDNKAHGVAATGHSEIDRQHEKLARLCSGLGSICLQREVEGAACVRCPVAQQRDCTDRLVRLLSDLMAFMVEHFAYESTLMRLLPHTDECRRHIEGHQLAHAEVSERLSRLTERLDREDPKQLSLRLLKIINAWIGHHRDDFDVVLAGALANDYGAEIDYDQELSRLLAQPGSVNVNASVG